MTACDHLRPALAAYVLGALDPAEAGEVRRHLDRCQACAAARVGIKHRPTTARILVRLFTASSLSCDSGQS